MTRESALWEAFRKGLKLVSDVLHVTRIENSTELGTPDVNGCADGVEFWVELKVAKRPKLVKTRVAVDHFTQEQRFWLFERHKAGGYVFLLLQCGRYYYLIRGDIAAVEVGRCDQERLRELSTYHGTSMADLCSKLTESSRAT